MSLARSSRSAAVFALLATGVTALSTVGCQNYREPSTDAPHAVVIGHYLGGTDDPKTGAPMLGYQAGVRACKGKQTRNDCGKFVPGKLEKRALTFRVRADKEITLVPLGLIDSKYFNNGVSYGTTQTYCVAEPRTITPRAGEKYEYSYLFEAGKGCGAVWKE